MGSYHKFETRLDYRVRSYLEKETKQNKKSTLQIRSLRLSWVINFFTS